MGKQYDEKDLAIACLLIIGVAALIICGDAGLDLARDIVIAIGSFVTGIKWKPVK